MKITEYMIQEAEKLLNVTTVHGLRNCFLNKLFFLRIFWGVIVLASLALSIYVMIVNIRNYEEFETKIKLTIKHDEIPTLPAITICNANPFNNNTATIQFIINTIIDIYNETIAGHIINFLGLQNVTSTITNSSLQNFRSSIIYYPDVGSTANITNFNDIFIYTANPKSESVRSLSSALGNNDRIVLLFYVKNTDTSSLWSNITNIIENSFSSYTTISNFVNYTITTSNDIQTILNSYAGFYSTGIMLIDDHDNSLKNNIAMWLPITSFAQSVDTFSYYHRFNGTAPNIRNIVGSIASLYTSYITITVQRYYNYVPMLQSIWDYVNSLHPLISTTTNTTPTTTNSTSTITDSTTLTTTDFTTTTTGTTLTTTDFTTTTTGTTLTTTDFTTTTTGTTLTTTDFTTTTTGTTLTTTDFTTTTTGTTLTTTDFTTTTTDFTTTTTDFTTTTTGTTLTTTDTSSTATYGKKKRSFSGTSTSNDFMNAIFSIFKTNDINVVLSEILYNVRASVIADRSLGRRFFLGQSFNDLVLSYSFNEKYSETNKQNIESFWNYKYGNCYIINPEQLTSKLLTKDHIEYVFEINAGNLNDVGRYLATNGIHLFVHDKGKNSILIDGGLDLPTGISGQIDVDKKVIKMLGKPYSNCIDSLFSLSKISPHLYSYMLNLNLTEYNQALCQKLCFQELLLNECGCLDFSIPIIKNGSFCFKFKDIECLKKFQNVFATSNLSDVCTPDCPQQCITTTYNLNKHMSKYPSESYVRYLEHLIPNTQVGSINKKKYLENTVLKLVIRYKHKSYEFYEHMPDMELFDIISKIGQYWGLFLGVSLISALELLELLVTIIARLFKPTHENYSNFE